MELVFFWISCINASASGLSDELPLGNPDPSREAVENKGAAEEAAREASLEPVASPEPTVVGAPAPVFSLKDLDGEIFRLQDRILQLS